MLSDFSVKIVNLYDAAIVYSRLLSTDDATSLGLDNCCGLLLLSESSKIFKILFTKGNSALDVEGEVSCSVHPHLNLVEDPEDKQLLWSKLWILVCELREFGDLPELVKSFSWNNLWLSLVRVVLSYVSNHYHLFLEENNRVNSRIVSEFNFVMQIHLINIDNNVAWLIHVKQKSLKSFYSLLL